ncbi:arsenate reductase family protein [Pseudooctadecabacter sp.]|uniref:arsenate reductase family protein n=1 Tax=Pseudooctadecabacter sp. TaxID=1966338 RepID=UPI0025DFDBE2|nr:ArsC/Spx/MgsR family protein [Pseudooctadecabacter sp.]
MRFFGLKTCDTCRKALKALDGHAVEVIDVRADGVSDDDRAAMVAAFGETVINKRSTTWRGLSEVEQSLDLDTLLKKHPTLLKRPVIDRDGVWLQGWTDDTKQALGVN